MATQIEEDFISYAELADIFPDVTKSDWNILAEGIGAFPVRRCPDDPYFNPRNRQILGFVNLDLDEMERIYRLFDDPEALTPEEKEEKYNPFLRFGAISLSEISRRNRIGVRKLTSVLADLGITPSQYYFGNNLPGKGLDRTQYSLIRPYLKHHRRMLPSKKVKSIKSWAAILRLDEDTLYARAREAGIDPKTYIFHGTPAYGLRRNEIKTIFEVFPDLERRLNVPLAKQTDMPITRIATGAGMDLRTLRNLMHDAEITPVDRMYPNGKVGETLTKQQRSALCLTYLKLMEQRDDPSNKIQYLTEWAAELNIHIDTLRTLIGGTQVQPLKRRTSKREFEMLTQSQIDQIAKLYEPFSRPENKPISVDVYARKNNTSSSVVVELATAAKIEVGYYLFRNKNAPGLLPHQITTLEETYRPFIELDDPLDATVTLASYASARGSSTITIEGKLRSIGVEPIVRPNPNGARKAKSMTVREQQKLEHFFPDLVIER